MIIQFWVVIILSFIGIDTVLLGIFYASDVIPVIVGIFFVSTLLSFVRVTSLVLRTKTGVPQQHQLLGPPKLIAAVVGSFAVTVILFLATFVGVLV